jgi:hypothetical protein
MKWLIIPLFIFILICGCSSNQPEVVETDATIVTPTPVAVTPTWIQTVGPTPTPTNDVGECYNRSLVEPPQFCYDYLYWVKPTPTVQGMGYTAKVWQNNGCINFNKTSLECECWGDDLWTVLFMKNLTIVKNLSSINNTELVSAVVFYNKSFDLNVINDDLTFSDFINMYWDKTYPTQPYDKSLFAPNPNVTIVPIDTFNPDGF